MSRLLVKIIKDKNGQILPMMALGMAVFIGFAAISVDYGYLAWQRRSLQNAADAGALAAAWELPNPGVTPVDQVALDDEAEYYTSQHVPASFKSAIPINNNEAVTVRAEKDYDRIFFSRIFTFFDEDAAKSDTLSAEATAARFVYYWDGLLPFASLDRYEEEWDEELEEYVWQTEIDNYYGKWDNPESFVEEQDYLSYLEDEEGKVKIDVVDNDTKELFKSDIDYFDLFMGTLIGKTINFREVSATSNANYGLLYLPTEDDPDGAKVLDIIRNNAGLPISFIGMDLGFKPGWLDAIQNPGQGQPDLSDKLEEQNEHGYIIAVLPSVAENTDPGSNNDNPSKTVLWGNYLVLELESIEINPDENNDSKVDKENPVSGKLVNSYNVYRGEIPKTRFNPNMRLGSVLIKP